LEISVYKSHHKGSFCNAHADYHTCDTVHTTSYAPCNVSYFSADDRTERLPVLSSAKAVICMLESEIQAVNLKNFIYEDRKYWTSQGKFCDSALVLVSVKP
jgi:hypothetical protein